MDRRAFIREQRKLSDMRTTEIIDSLRERRGDLYAYYLSNTVNILDPLLYIGMIAAANNKDHAELVVEKIKLACESMSAILEQISAEPEVIEDMVSTFWTVANQRSGDYNRAVSRAS